MEAGEKAPDGRREVVGASGKAPDGRREVVGAREKAVFAGTRVPVEVLIDYLKAGDSLERFLEGFPTVRREQAEAFLELALEAALKEQGYASAA